MRFKGINARMAAILVLVLLPSHSPLLSQENFRPLSPPPSPRLHRQSSFPTLPENTSQSYHSILIDAGPTETSNYIRYYNELRKGYEVLKHLGQKPKIMAKDGKWKVINAGFEKLSNFSLSAEPVSKTVYNRKEVPTYPAIQSEFTGPASLEKMLREMKPKKGDQIFLYFSGHGYPDQNGGQDPSQVQVAAWGGSMTWEEIGNILEKHSGVKFKISSSICYGGGVHYLSRRLSNTCAVANTSHFSPSSSGTNEIGIFGNQFFDHLLKTKGKTSFGETALTAIKNDQANIRLGKVSSMDYIDFVLGRGAYAKNFPEPVVKRVTLRDSRNIYQFMAPDDLSSFMPVEDSAGEGGQCTELDERGFDIPVLLNLYHILTEVFIQEKWSVLQNALQTSSGKALLKFMDVQAKDNQGGPTDLKMDQEIKKELEQLKVDYENYLTLSPKDPFKYDELHDRIYDKYQDLKEKINDRIGYFLFQKEVVRYADKLSQFFREANPEQIQKFNNLLKCEWESFFPPPKDADHPRAGQDQ